MMNTVLSVFYRFALRVSIVVLVAIVAVWSAAVYLRHPGKSGSCPDVTASALSSHITRYFRVARHDGDKTFSVLTGTKQEVNRDDMVWLVPIVHRGAVFTANVDCRGRVELSDGWP
ncbi:hypothetical protein [Pandoraea anhela]|uniref:Uncharacterized protein n=1 Tax=Pandoraea anhela TaxID=2508295 RepID=A0A5E4YLH7_9BURK|nr:hypothetical protein [Pandoraea anhela]VVE49621.1 hypothetical protein PAN31108_04620 [Pandoraea anhela]